MVFALQYSLCFEPFCRANILQVHLWGICTTKWLKNSTYMDLTLSISVICRPVALIVIYVVDPNVCRLLHVSPARTI